MASFHTPSELLAYGDFIYDKFLTVTEVTTLEGTGVIVAGRRGGTGKAETHTFETDDKVWIHRTNHIFDCGPDAQ